MLAQEGEAGGGGVFVEDDGGAAGSGDCEGVEGAEGGCADEVDRLLGGDGADFVADEEAGEVGGGLVGG